MARTLDLRKYQEDILERIRDKSKAADAAAHGRLGVRAGPLHLLVRLDDISEVLPVPEIHAVPMAKPWFLGMANVRGNLYCISDLAHFCGHAPTVRGPANRILLIHHKYKAQAALLVDQVMGLRSLEQMAAGEDEAVQDKAGQDQAGQDQAGLDSRLAGDAFRDGAGTTWREIGLTAMLAIPEFMKVAQG
jgi:twitching motility protein PilI